MANVKLNPDTVRPPGANYTHSVETRPGSRHLYIAGQVGMAPDGSVPDGIEAQATIAFDNVGKILAASGYGLEDVVFLRTYLTRREDRPGYQKARDAAWGGIKPASTFLLVSGLAMPEYLVEVEVVAAKA